MRWFVAAFILWSSFGIAQTFFRDKANGSLIIDTKWNGSWFGLDRSKLFRRTILSFTSFGGGNGYDAANSGGSNLGPTSQKLYDAIKERIEAYRKENGLNETDSVPADAVTASGSGLDPHISLRNAQLQTARVAKARHLSEEKVRALIQQNTDAASFGFIGESGVNVLKLNLALDSIK